MNFISTLTVTVLTALITCLPADDALAVCTGQFAPGQVCANNTAALAPPGPTSNLVLGIPGTTLGSLDMSGSTSGQVHIVPQNAAGSATIKWPTTTGTLASSATSPLALDPVTGTLTCTTCLTGAGGALTATNPLSVTGNNIALAYDSNFINNGSNQLAFSSIASGNLLANSTAGLAEPTSTTVTALIDRAIGSTRGSILERGVSVWGAITPGTAAYPFVSNGAGFDPAYQQLTGAGMVNNTVGNAQIRQGGAQTVIGVSGNATANVADIQASAADQILRATGAGTSIGFGAIDLSKSAAVGSSVLCLANGGLCASQAAATSGQIPTIVGGVYSPTTTTTYYPQCDLTGVTDCSSAIQTQINLAQTNGGGTVQLPCTGSGNILVNTGVTISNGGIRLRGCGVEEFKGYQGQYTSPSYGIAGTRIHTTSVANHPITVASGANGAVISDVVFSQDQPVDAPGWTPTAYPATIYHPGGSVAGTSTGRLEIENVLFAGVYIGIQSGTDGGGVGLSQFTGRDYYHNVRGSFFSTAINLLASGDIARIEDLHVWPAFYLGANTPNITAYVQANVQGISTTRDDNPMWSNLFFYGVATGIRFNGGNPDGPTQGTQINNLNCDKVHKCIFVDNTTGSGQFTAAITNMSSFGVDSSVSGDYAINTFVNTSDVSISVVNAQFGVYYGSAVLIDGTANVLTIINSNSHTYNQQPAGTNPFVTATAGNAAYLRGTFVNVNTNASPSLGSANVVDLTSTARTGTGSTIVYSTSPTLVTPALGTPSSVTLTNAIGLPVGTGISGLGTGVATALGINVGSAGAFVTFNGALGTPSSGTATNLSGTAASLTAGNATNSAITNDVATAANMNLAWVTSTTGNLPIKVSGGNLIYNPSTGYLSTSLSQTGDTIFNITNSSANAAATARLQIQTDGSVYTMYGQSNAGGGGLSQTWTGAGTYIQNANNATGSFAWYTGSAPNSLKMSLSNAGVLNAVGGISANGSAGLSTTCTITAGNSYVFTFGLLTTKGANCT